MSLDEIPLPRFIIIGAQKSATRWLRLNLGRHPDIFTAPEEPAFFDHQWRYEKRGLNWYRKQFSGWEGEPIVGEATPGYMIWRHDPAAVAARIHETLPEVQLIALLRNPIDRAASALAHHRRRKRVPDNAKLIDLIRENAPETHRIGLIAGGWYGQSLEPYINQFDDRLAVFLHDDIKSNARLLYRTALEHIGEVDATFAPDDLDQVRFTNQSKPSNRVELSQDERVEIYNYFRDDLQRLELLINRDLSAWDPSTN